MNKRILLAGASGVVGQRLAKLLVTDGWQVIGTTRSASKVPQLRALGIQPVIIDVFDAELLKRIVVEVQPAIVIHQLTDLPPGLDPEQMPEATGRNAHLRDVGTRNLVAAAVRAGVRRIVAQSIAFAYAPGPGPYSEESPLNTEAPDRAGVSARGVASLEQQILAAPPEGLVLRYGKFYGSGTGFDAPATGGAVHVDAAAEAARLAVTHGKRGIYNIAEEDGTVSSRKATEELTWNPGFRMS